MPPIPRSEPSRRRPHADVAKLAAPIRFRASARPSFLAAAFMGGLALTSVACSSGELGSSNTPDTPVGGDPNSEVNSDPSNSNPGNPSAQTPSPGTSSEPGTANTSGTDPVPTDGPITPGASTTPPPPASVIANANCDAVDTSPSVLRRLTKLEYQLTLKELFRLDSIPETATVPEDSDFKGFHTVAALENVTTEHLRAYQTEADAQFKALWSDATRRDAVIGCDAADGTCLRSFVETFGKVAYRRALTTEEVDSIVGLGTENGATAEEQFSTAVAGLLTSANFLFRVEVGDTQEGLSTLTGEELASRLSFALLGRGPSAELLDRGTAGELATDAGLLATAKELLADPRAQEFYTAFFRQWLGFEKMRAPKAPAAGWNDALLTSMQEETTRFLDEYAWQEGANFMDSLNSNHSYIRADLAEFYGLPAPAAGGYVEFPADHNRANSGLLSHAALISAKNDGDRIAHRGAWVQRTFLCLTLEVPTALLDQLADELSGLTYPQMLEKRNAEQPCSGCHALIDPIGAGFSGYDEIGHFDASFDTHQYGITPALPGGAAFETLGELAAQLRARADVADCITSKVFLYTDGREATTQDACALKQASTQFADDQYRFASILEGLVTTPDFRTRRAPEPVSEEVTP